MAPESLYRAKVRVERAFRPALAVALLRSWGFSPSGRTCRRAEARLASTDYEDAALKRRSTRAGFIVLSGAPSPELTSKGGYLCYGRRVFLRPVQLLCFPLPRMQSLLLTCITGRRSSVKSSPEPWPI